MNPMRKIERHIIHCSASEFGDVAEIRKWHIARGWRDVGYHFVIRQDGEIELGRTLPEIGAHCEGFNATSVGTCLIGTTKFTPAQFARLKKIHTMLQALFPGITYHGHRDFNLHKTCPNFEVAGVLGVR
jgi:N-acetylmuramoyl-L-alanine amidase